MRLGWMATWAGWITFCALPPATALDGDYLVYFVTYTATTSKGIHACRFELSTGKVTPIGVVAEGRIRTFSR